VEGVKPPGEGVKPPKDLLPRPLPRSGRGTSSPHPTPLGAYGASSPTAPSQKTLKRGSDANCSKLKLT